MIAPAAMLGEAEGRSDDSPAVTTPPRRGLPARRKTQKTTGCATMEAPPPARRVPNHSWSSSLASMTAPAGGSENIRFSGSA